MADNEVRAISLVILGIVAIVAVIGLVLMLSGRPQGTGAFVGPYGFEKETRCGDDELLSCEQAVLSLCDYGGKKSEPTPWRRVNDIRSDCFSGGSLSLDYIKSLCSSLGPSGAAQAVCHGPPPPTTECVQRFQPCAAAELPCCDYFIGDVFADFECKLYEDGVYRCLHPDYPS